MSKKLIPIIIEDVSFDVTDPEAMLAQATRPLERNGKIDVVIDEPLRFVIERLRKRAKTATPEQKQLLAMEIETYRAKLAEDRKNRNAYFREYYAKLTPEQRAKKNENQRRCRAQTKERQQELRQKRYQNEKNKAGEALLSDLERDRQRKQKKLSTMTPEQLQAYREERRAYARKWYRRRKYES